MKKSVEALKELPVLSIEQAERQIFIEGRPKRVKFMYAHCQGRGDSSDVFVAGCRVGEEEWNIQRLAHNREAKPAIKWVLFQRYTTAEALGVSDEQISQMTDFLKGFIEGLSRGRLTVVADTLNVGAGASYRVTGLNDRPLLASDPFGMRRVKRRAA